MQNAAKARAGEEPVSFEFDREATHVKVPINAWKTLVHCARVLEPLAMMIATMEQIGQTQIEEGELHPVYMDDTEPIPGAKPDTQGRVPRKIKESFWNKTKKSQSLIQTLGKPEIVMADGKTIYNSADPSPNEESVLKPSDDESALKTSETEVAQ